MNMITYLINGYRIFIRNIFLTYYGYDANDHITYIEDANGNITRFVYDSIGNLVSATYPLSADGIEPDYRIKYDSLDKPVEIVDALGGIRHIKRDANGRIIERTGNIAGSVIKYEYGVIDQPEKVMYSDGGIEIRKYDVNNNLIKNIYPEAYKSGGEDGAAICNEYDCNLIRVVYIVIL